MMHLRSQYVTWLKRCAASGTTLDVSKKMLCCAALQSLELFQAKMQFQRKPWLPGAGSLQARIETLCIDRRCLMRLVDLDVKLLGRGSHF